MASRAIIMQLDDIDEECRLAKLAEDSGFDLVWSPDTPRSNAFVHLAALAKSTNRIQIGSGIIRSFVRAPLQIAAGAADLDRLSGGRFTLGLASGTPKQNLNETGQEFPHPASRLKELIRILRELWELNGERDFHFEGRFYKILARGFTLPKPVRTEIPIYIGAVNQGMLRLCGEVADGLAGHPCFSVAYMKKVVLPCLEEGLRMAGRNRQQLKTTSWIITSISPDRQKARREAAYQIGFYLATRSYSPLLDFHGWQEEGAAIRHAFHELRDMEAVSSAVSDKMIDELAIAGTPEECRERLERYKDVLDFPTLYPPGVGPARVIPQHRVRENLELIIKTFAVT